MNDWAMGGEIVFAVRQNFFAKVLTDDLSAQYGLQNRPPGSKIYLIGATKPFNRPNEVRFIVFFKRQVIHEIFSAPYRVPEERDISGAYQEVRKLVRQRVNNSGSDRWRVSDDDNGQTASRRKLTGWSCTSWPVQVNQLSLTCGGL
jgi:hypothetical protein